MSTTSNDLSTAETFPPKRFQDHTKDVKAQLGTLLLFIRSATVDASVGELESWASELDQLRLRAAFLGYTRAVRLIRVLATATMAISTRSPSERVGGLSLIQRAAEMLPELLSTSTQSKEITLLGTIEEILSRLQLRESDLIQHSFRSSKSVPKDWQRETEKICPEAAHNDTPFYRNTALDGLAKCSEEESWTVAQLATLAEDLACGTRSTRPAQQLMNVLRGHRFFRQVDRVCLAGRVNESNQLVIIDACTSENCADVKLRPGYSCFVNPNGSLFKMKPGVVRVFGDSHRVLEAFSERGQPVQRSIALVSDSGLRSGLCLAIGRGEQIQGFLFLNSCKPDLFGNIAEDYAPLLSLFALVATVAFDSAGFGLGSTSTSRLAEQGLPVHAVLFTSNDFAGYVRQSLRILSATDRPIDIHSQIEADFLYLPRTVVRLLSSLIDRMGLAHCVDQKPLEITVKREGPDICMAFAHARSANDGHDYAWLARTIRAYSEEFRNKPIRLDFNPMMIELRFPFEPVLANSSHSFYSVVY